MKLYEIPLAWQELQEALEASGGELTPEIEALWSQLQEDGAAKVDAAACVLRAMKASQEALATEIGRLQGRKQALENAEERLRALILPAVQALGGKVKTDRFTVYTTTRKTFAFALKPGYDVWSLDPRFYRVREPELAKTEIKKAIEAGEEIPELEITPTESTSLTVR